MAVELVAGAVNTAHYDHLRASDFARIVFLFDNACSKLAEDLHLYSPYFDPAAVPADHEWTQEARVFQQTLESARSLLQECQQLKDRSGGVFHPMQRLRFGKKIIRLRDEIRQSMLDNRLRILAIWKLEALEPPIELRLATPEEEDKELLGKISEVVKKIREEMQRLSGKSRENTAKIMDLMRTMNNDDPSSTENAAAGSSQFSTASNQKPLPSLVVGLDEHVERLKRMLLLSGGEANSNKMTIVGGMGGIGKTTLALAVCHDQQVKDFFRQRIHFITVSRNPDMVALLCNIWTKVTGHKSLPKFENLDDAYAQLCCKLAHHMQTLPPSSKCLLVLDNVCSNQSLERLIFDIPGFWTLVTTRQAQELETIILETQTYEMECLEPTNARRLFCCWTFGQEDIPLWADETLVEEVISECKGLPLALNVIAGSLSSTAEHKQECVWRQTRDKLRQAEQQEGLVSRLRTSVDALDGKLRDCFMDAGAFPEDAENPVDNVLDIWVHVRGMDWDDAYCALVELASRCLLDLATSKPRSSFPCVWDGDWDTSAGDLSEYGYGGCVRFWQHDVIRDLAIQLGMENLPVEHRSWLFMPHPEARLPNEWQAPISFAARVISISCTDYRTSQDWPTLLFPNAEALFLYDLHNELPLFVFSMSRLKVLVVRRSSAVGHEGWRTHQTFRPCIQGLHSLQSLYIDQGGGAIHISTHHSIDGLALASQIYQRLITRARLRGQTVYPDVSGLHIGDTLCDITRTTGICCVPKPRKVMVSGYPVEIKCDMVEMASLTSSLDILKLTIGTLPEQHLLQLANVKVLVVPDFPTKVSLFSSCELNNLKVLVIGSLRNASLVCKLKSLEVLEILDCSLLEKLPGDVGQLQCLRRLVLDGLDKLKHLPHSMGQLGCLKELRLKGVFMLEELPESLVKLGNLETLELSSCYCLKRLPHNIGKLECLKELNLCKAEKLEELPESLVELRHLQRLTLSGCQRLNHFPHEIGQLQSLREIDLRGSPLEELLEESLAEWRHLVLRD